MDAEHSTTEQVGTILIETLINLGTSVGTLGLAGIAFCSIKAEKKEREASQKDRRRAQMDRDIAEARQRKDRERFEERGLQADADRVTWWTNADEPVGESREFVGEEQRRLWYGELDAEYEPGHRHVSLHIRNDNNSAVHSCAVYHEELQQYFFIGMLPPGEHVYRTQIRARAGSTSERVTVRIAEGLPVGWVEFVDRHGVLWHRTRTGQLEQHRDQTPQDGNGFVV